MNKTYKQMLESLLERVNELNSPGKAYYVAKYKPGSDEGTTLELTEMSLEDAVTMRDMAEKMDPDHEYEIHDWDETLGTMKQARLN